VVDWRALEALVEPAALIQAARDLLEPRAFDSLTTFDALNRPLTLTTPDRSVIYPILNEANLLEKVEVQLRGAAARTVFVKDINYDAKGQRQLIRYGNDVVTTYEYDDKTFRLIHLRTDRANAFPADQPKGIQNLFYTYDPVGNITEIRDDAQQTIFFNNARVAPRNEYEYDALYQLIRAEGREHIGQVADPQPEYNFDDFPRVNLPHPNDANAMRDYIELYEYDSVGNILRMIHQATNGDWIRRYDYETTNNRLRNTSFPGDPADLSAISPRYLYDEHGSMTKMPHLFQMDWDFKDELQRVDLGGGGVAYYVYDAAGQRVRKVIERQTGARQKERIYLGGFEIYREYNGDGGTVTLERETLHVMDDQQRIALVETRTVGDDDSSAQLIRYQFGNHLGSASLELDEAGGIISYEEYYPYGSTAYQAVDKRIKAAAKRYRYTGMERDEETGLAYHGARYYAGWLGRWTVVDPKMENYISESPYVGMGNNPVTHVDPTGEADFDAGLEDVVKDKDGFWKRITDETGQNLNGVYSDILGVMADPDTEIVFHFDDIVPNDFKGQVWDAINDIESGTPLDEVIKNAADNERLTAAEFTVLVNYTDEHGNSLIDAERLGFEFEGEPTTIKKRLGETLDEFQTPKAVAKLKELIPKFQAKVASEVAEKVTKEVADSAAKGLARRTFKGLGRSIPVIGFFIALPDIAQAAESDEYGRATLMTIGLVVEPVDWALTAYDYFNFLEVAREEHQQRMSADPEYRRAVQTGVREGQQRIWRELATGPAY
jgi:RHS repeat-associated protein